MSEKKQDYNFLTKLKAISEKSVLIRMLVDFLFVPLQPIVITN